MKLAEIKNCLIDQFFTETSDGVLQEQLVPIFESIGTSLGIDLKPDQQTALSDKTVQSADPSKAFKRFTDGRVAMLTIFEDDHAIFATVRAGTQIKLVDLTTSPIVEKAGNLLAVKTALRQAKNRNDEVFFNIMIN